jgi:purine-binding chemotaxis protein CheW
MVPGETVEAKTYLTFTLDHEDFAVDVAGVREVLDFTTVTRVPRTPEFMKGVINLRGSVVPVVDLRLKFGLLEAEKTVDTCVIVLEVELEGEVTVIGAIADSVKEVFELGSSDIEPPPRLGTRFETEFISGMGKHNDDFIIILDVNRVFSGQEMELFRHAEDSPSQLDSDVEQMEEVSPKGEEEPGVAVDDAPDEKQAEPDLPPAVEEDAAPTDKKPVRASRVRKKSTSGTPAKTAKKTGKSSAKKIEKKPETP